MQLMVRIPAGEGRGREGLGRGWVVLRATKDDFPEVLCFCWERAAAEEIYKAMGGQERGHVWLGEATIEE